MPQLVLALVLTTVMLAGCGGPSLVGTWIAHRPIQKNPGASEGLTNTVSQVKLTIDSDDHFTLEDAGVPKTGEVQHAGRSATLVVKEMFGQSVEKQPEDVQKRNVPIQLTLEKDGTLSFYDPKGFDPSPLSMTKQPVGN